MRRELKKNATKPQRQFPYNIGKKPEPKDLFWKDLLENAQRHQGFLINREGPKLVESHKNLKTLIRLDRQILKVFSISNL